MIRPIKASDIARIVEIYNHYILHTIVTFELETINNSEMKERVAKVTKDHPWLVVENDGLVVGYAYSSWWHARAAYSKSIEFSVYLDPPATGKGLGKLLYHALLDDAIKRGFHTVIGGISLPNAASVGLHEKIGFKKAAHYREVGYKFDKWIDVGYWQLIL
ncbi:MAG: arsinothricin resistance N-acetyltransferase ArsN1 family B [Flavobacteriales bacterium]